jgi:hypothetical protein
MLNMQVSVGLVNVHHWELVDQSLGEGHVLVAEVRRDVIGQDSERGMVE